MSFIATQRRTFHKLYMTQTNNNQEDEEEIISLKQTNHSKEEEQTIDNDSHSGNLQETFIESQQEQEGEGEGHEEEEEEEEEEIDPFILECKSWSQSIDKALERCNKKQQSLQIELEKSRNMEQTAARAQLIVSNFHVFASKSTSSSSSTYKVMDWNTNQEVELTLDTKKYDSPQQEADALFAKVRKLKRGSARVSELLQESNGAIQLLKQSQQELNQCITQHEQEEDTQDQQQVILVKFQQIQKTLLKNVAQTLFQQPQQQKQTKSSSTTTSKNKRKSSVLDTSIRKLKSPAGCIVFVGRNRRGNEHLSLQIARGNDVWMHARGYPGAHVLLQQRRGSPKPTRECLDFCANLAIFYSDARLEDKALVTVAEPKHVLKPRGAPLGAVKLRKEAYTLVGRPHLVPSELKEARMEQQQNTGGGEEQFFRATDKAKHRRQTAAVAKQQSLAKRRAKAEKKKRKRNHYNDDNDFNNNKNNKEK